MEQRIREYLINEKKVESPVVREMLIKKVLKYDDIAEEFLGWLNTREYAGDVVIEGYSAQQVRDLAPFLEGIGAYNFLVTLRDDPEGAKKIIKDGFRVL